MRKLGLADGLGIVAVAVAALWLPGASDPLTGIKLLVLSAGSLVMAPAIVHRLFGLGRQLWLFKAPLAGAILLCAWALISSVGSGAPIWNSVFGWWGRGDGLLALIGATLLFLGAASLRRDEVARVQTYLLAGGTLIALVGLTQAIGVDLPKGSAGRVTGTMGNSNFAAGWFAIIAVLAMGRALSHVRVAERIWSIGLFCVLAFLCWRTDSLQGPVALAGGLLVLGVAYAAMYRGRFRLVALGGAAALVGVIATLLALSTLSIGPLSRLWSENTFDIRQQYWLSAIRMMNELPIFGTGPGGFSRYVAEFRPESYVQTVGPTIRVSAAHNIALQFGATLGWMGLLLWVLVFAGAAVALLWRMRRPQHLDRILTAAVAGSIAAYLIQGIVSIDMLPLLATGWLVTGLGLALARSPQSQDDTSVNASRSSTEAPARTRLKTKATLSTGKTNQAPIPAWAYLVGGGAAFGAAVLVGSQIALANEVQVISSQQQAVEFVTNPMTPCVLRVQVTQQIIQQVPVAASVPAVLAAENLDHRCPPMINFASDVLLQQGRFDEANRSTAEGVTIDPLLDVAWILRADYLLQVGQVQAAREAASEARRVQGLYNGDSTLLDALEDRISKAIEVTG